jgi:hypothetical protein
MGINSIRNKVLMLCPSFDKIDPLMGDGTLANPSFVGHSMDGMDAKDFIYLLFFS